MKRPPIVIVGASLAGGTAAVTLREDGFDGDIVLVGAEARPPYNRPPLSKGYLRGQDRFEDQLVKPANYYAEQRITLKLGTRATKIDAGQKIVELEGGERVAYDRLLVATGGRNRTLSVPGRRSRRRLPAPHRRGLRPHPRRRRPRPPRGRDGLQLHRLRGVGVLAPARRRGGGRRELAYATGPDSRRRGRAGARRHPPREGSRPDRRRIPSPRSRARTASSACGPRRAESSTAIWWWRGSGSCPTRSSWRRPARRSTTASSWTSAAGRRCRTCSPRAT